VTVLRRFPSLSNPGESRIVSLDDEERVYCTCPGWKFHGHCWHVDTLLGEDLDGLLALRGVKLIQAKTGEWKFERIR